MNKSFVFAGVACVMMSVSVPASAADLSAQMGKCLTKHANTKQAANITVECTAADGKLSGCKVIQSEAPSKGFEQAAICVAEVLPMGAKSGTIRVPVRFPGA
ncbi:MAG: hypothetical protein EBS42_10135 [Caulobacteraceae bacterium]|nr:hypothetical protein [Caulobacteraceae bacterium]